MDDLRLDSVRAVTRCVILDVDNVRRQLGYAVTAIGSSRGHAEVHHLVPFASRSFRALSLSFVPRMYASPRKVGLHA